MIAIYITGALTNLLLLLLFRAAFTDTPQRKKMFSWICLGATIFSFALWVVWAVIFIYDYFKFYKNGNNDRPNAKA